MALNFGPIMQNGYVVPAIEPAVRHWAEKIGVGPFYLLEHVAFGPAWFRGEPLQLDMSVAIAQWGEVQIELIVQHDSSRSIYTEFTAAHGRGLQHVGVVTEALDAQLERLQSLGITPVQWGTTAAGMKFAYLNSDAHPGGMIELMERGPALDAFFAKVRAASIGWDGSRPLRRLG
jgi:hypothetical protein